MNVIVAGVGPSSASNGAIGVGGGTFIGGLAVVGLILLLGALRSARRAPVYVVRDIGRPY
jgi:hypothetical protein